MFYHHQPKSLDLANTVRYKSPEYNNYVKLGRKSMSELPIQDSSRALLFSTTWVVTTTRLPMLFNELDRSQDKDLLGYLE